MSDLKRLGESVVDETEIDALGHLNVRSYIVRAHSANLELLARAGLTAETTDQIDLYSRYLKEQGTGARLCTFGGFLENEDGGVDLRTYLEIRNEKTLDLAAILIIGNEVKLDNTRIGNRIPGFAVDELRVRLPEHGKPRSLTLSPPRKARYTDIEPRILARPSEPGRPGGRMEVLVHPDDCDPSGVLRREIDLMLMIYDRSAPRKDGQIGPTVLEDAEGRSYGWAMMEARTFTFRRARVGDRLTSLGGDISYTDKVRLTRRWIFDENSEAIGIHDAISLCIDLETRRSRPIPVEIMKSIEQHCLDEFA